MVILLQRCILDEEDLDPSKSTTQYITFEVVDSAGNIATAKLEILFEEPGFSISGFAIDGYLIGSQITFVPKSADLQYLTRTVSTNEDGSFDLDFLASEFQALDANKNGVIDLEEASIKPPAGSTPQPTVNFREYLRQTRKLQSYRH